MFFFFFIRLHNACSGYYAIEKLCANGFRLIVFNLRALVSYVFRVNRPKSAPNCVSSKPNNKGCAAVRARARTDQKLLASALRTHCV